MELVTRDRQELLKEIEDLKTRLEESENTLHAIRQGEVDALVPLGPKGEQVFTLKGFDYTYRIVLETMKEGVAAVSPDGTVLFCNK